MPPRGTKRARGSSPDEGPTTPKRRTTRTATTTTPTARKRAASPETPHADEDVGKDERRGEPVSHLMSFLTGYADREHGSDSEGESSASGGSDGEDDDPDEDDSRMGTPGKRGLVGLATPRKRKTGSAALTPRRRTPAKAKEKPLEIDEGFLRMTRADTYFLTASRAAATSGLSYAALARPLSQAEYEAAATGVRGTNARVVAALEAAEAYFPQWAAELDAGFNLLIHGYGSKRRLVNSFVTKSLAKRGHVAVVNGHFPQLGLRDVLATLEDTLSIPDAAAPPAATPLERAAHRVYAHFSKPSASKAPLFLVLHNIDAPALRTPKALSALALLASSPGIHIVATFDHVHTPLLFSASVSSAPPHDATTSKDGFPPSLRGFNWLYHSVATFDDYDIELSYARLSATSLGALGQAGASGVSEEGALQILRSVPPMAARLLKLILTRQIAALPDNTAMHAAHPPAATAPAFALDVDLLQKTARDRFIAREEDRFNALMGEFKDHGLVVVAELDAEGRTGRWAWVPLGKAAIERILEEMKDVET